MCLQLKDNHLSNMGFSFLFTTTKQKEWENSYRLDCSVQQGFYCIFNTIGTCDSPQLPDKKKFKTSNSKLIPISAF